MGERVLAGKGAVDVAIAQIETNLRQDGDERGAREAIGRRRVSPGRVEAFELGGRQLASFSTGGHLCGRLGR